MSIKWEEKSNISLIIIEKDIVKILYAGAEIPEEDKEEEEL